MYSAVIFMPISANALYFRALRMEIMELSREQLVHIAHTYGTPVYVYHAERIGHQYAQLKDAFSAVDARFFYASKALTNINVLRYIRQIGCHVDCSSENEVRLALQAGFQPDQILYTSNGVAFEEIEAVQGLGVHINIDSLSNLTKFGKRFGGSYPVGVRLRPDIMAGGNLKISTGHDRSKFGIPIKQLDELLQIQTDHDLFIRNLHIHTGSEIKDVAVFAQGIEVLFDIVHHFPRLEVIDLGGGFKVPYSPNEKGTDMQALGRKVQEEFASFEEKTGKHLQVWFEPGKFLVSQAGYFITTVNVLKQSGAITFAGVNAGLNQLIRPMFYDAYHQIDNITNPTGSEQVYTVTGNVCETDTFAADRSLPEVREGDLLVFRNAGAYGFEMASNYNARFKPAEVMVINDQAHLIRRRDTLDDLLRNQIEFIS
jgi:diaminopimelate decarboxylase